MIVREIVYINAIKTLTPDQVYNIYDKETSIYNFSEYQFVHIFFIMVYFDFAMNCVCTQTSAFMV